MSDHVMWIVDLDSSLEDAETFAAQVKEWLVKKEIVSSAACSTAAYDGRTLLLPGACAFAPEWATFDMQHPPAMHGFATVVERKVFHTGGNGIQGIRCPRCSQRHDPEDVAWSDAAEAWYSQEGDDSVTCPTCAIQSKIIDWQFLESDWAFGNLAFAFWNWPVSENIAQGIGSLLGHRCRLVHEHI